MKKIIYTRAEDNGVSVVHAVPKESIEQLLGPLTQEQYEAHIWERSVPKNAINPRLVDDKDLSYEDEFRDAWKDDGKKIDYNYQKAKEIQLGKVRRKRNELLDSYDKKININEDEGKQDVVRELKFKRQQLRDATESLKNLNPKSIQEIKDATPSLAEYE